MGGEASWLPSQLDAEEGAGKKMFQIQGRMQTFMPS